MASMGEVRAILILRIFTLALLAASIALLVTNNYKLVVLGDEIKVKFKDVIAYRYVLATACVGSLYTMIQIPFAIYHAFTEKRLIRNSRFPQEFDFYGDKIISFLLATGVGVGFGVSFEMKRYVNGVFDLLLEFGIEVLEEGRNKTHKFLKMGIIATGLLGGAFLCMAILTKLTSKPRYK